MKIIHTVTYNVERMTIKDFLANHGYRLFMERPHDDPSSVIGNKDWLNGQRASKKLYVVNDMAETTKLVPDNQSSEPK